MGARHPEPNQTRRRAGFTVQELLVSISVVALLAALILPAVQASRARSRSLQCRNNLRQFGLALQAHAAAEGRLPSGSDGGWSVTAKLLPWLEAPGAAAELKKVDGGPVYGDWSKTTYGRAELVFLPPVGHCPEDGGSVGPLASYHPNTGVSRHWLGAADGPFRTSLRTGAPGLRLGDVRDGAGTTAAYSEALVGGPEPTRTVRNVRHDYLNTPEATAYMIEDCRTLPPPRDKFDGGLPLRGSRWPVAIRGSCGYIHAAPPGTPACLRGGREQSGLWPADSGHRGLVNVAFLDGAVRGVSTSVDAALWRAAGTPDGEEVLNADAF